MSFFWGGTGYARRETVEAGEIGVVVETPQSLCDSSPINKGAENVKGENGKMNGEQKEAERIGFGNDGQK